jgi:hypothetical protein
MYMKLHDPVIYLYILLKITYTVTTKTVRNIITTINNIQDENN